MKATEQDFAEMNRILDERGYLVILSVNQYLPWHRITEVGFSGREISQPLVVVCETDLADYQAQCAVTGLTPAHYSDDRFYRVVTD